MVQSCLRSVMRMEKIKTDEEQVIDGLDKVVMKMKKGEVTLLTIVPEYAFGLSEWQQELAVVPPNSTLFYEVDLVSFKKDEGAEICLKSSMNGTWIFTGMKPSNTLVSVLYLILWFSMPLASLMLEMLSLSPEVVAKRTINQVFGKNIASWLKRAMPKMKISVYNIF